MRGLITDSDAAVAHLLVPGGIARATPAAGAAAPAAEPALRPLDAGAAAADAVLAAVFGADAPLLHADFEYAGWRTVLVRDRAPGSQFDALTALARAGRVPHRLACLARHGAGFHGAGGRAWSALPGNIHLTVHFPAPRALISHTTLFTALGAVACADTVDRIAGPGVRARIKWVNDVLVDGRKVAGVIAYGCTRDAAGSAVIGIGLNVERTPRVERSPDVPAVTALNEHAPGITVAAVTVELLAALDRAWQRLLADGPAPLLHHYRARSAVIGEEVAIRSGAGSDVIATGRVARIGDDLELYLEGRPEPVRNGRLVLGTFAGEAHGR